MQKFTFFIVCILRTAEKKNKEKGFNMISKCIETTKFLNCLVGFKQLFFCSFNCEMKHKIRPSLICFAFTVNIRIQDHENVHTMHMSVHFLCSECWMLQALCILKAFILSVFTMFSIPGTLEDQCWRILVNALIH